MTTTTHTIALGTRAQTHRCPITETSDEPIRFVGVGGLGAIHAISFVLDRRPIQEILLVDADEQQLDFTVAAVRAAMESATREAWLEHVYAVTPRTDEIRDWRDLDLTRLLPQWASHGEIDGPDDEGLLTIGRSGSCAGTVVSLPWTGRPHQMSVGWNFGALLEGAFPFPRIPVRAQSRRLSEALEDWTDDTVVWVSDAWTDSSDRCGGILDPALSQRLRALDRLPNIRIYAAAQQHEALEREVLVKDYAGMLTRERPHFYTNEAIQRMRLGRSMIYIMHDEGAPRPGQLPDSILIGPMEFLRSGMTADTVVLHIMSQSDLYAEAAHKALTAGRRLLVLEHNRHTEDRHLLHNGGESLHSVRALVGKREEAVRWCFGRRGGLRRNFVAAFAGHTR